MKIMHKDIINWENKSADSSGCPGGKRSDRILSSLIEIEKKMILVLPRKYNYSIFYYDEKYNFVLLDKVSSFGYERILFPGEKIKIYGAADETINIDEFIKNYDIYEFDSIPLKSLNDFFLDKNIKLIGDSITAGSGGTGYGYTGKAIVTAKGFERYENLYGICWANYLKYYCEKNKLCSAVINAGCSKYTTATILKNIEEIVEDEDDIILCMIGTDDRLIKNDSLMHFIKRINSIIAYCLHRGKWIIIISPPPSTIELQTSVNYTLKEIDDALRDNCKRLNIPFISTYAEMQEIITDNDIVLSDLLVDGLYPNDNGYYYIFSIIYKNLGINLKNNKCEFNKPFIVHHGESLYLPVNSKVCINETEIITSSVRNVFFFDSTVSICTTAKGFMPYVIEESIPVNEKNSNLKDYFNYMRKIEMKVTKRKKPLSDALLPGIEVANHKFVEKAFEGEIYFPTGTRVYVSKDLFKMSFKVQQRTNQLWLKSLFWLSFIVFDYEQTHNEQCLKMCEQYICEFLIWLNWDFDKIGFNQLPSADHSCAIRSVVFYNLLQIFPDNWGYRDDLLLLLYQHAIWMMEQSKYIKNNHGTMMLIGMLHIAELLDESEFKTKLLSHIHNECIEIYNENFFSDGLCKENSVGYHVFNLEQFEKIFKVAEKFGIQLDLKDMAEKLSKSEKVIQQMIWQNAEIPPIGDSPIYAFDKPSINETHYYKEGNWVVIKKRDRYFSFKCGFGSKAHKHVDDGSISLRCYETDLIVDSGMYNYDRTNEIRQYVESARGHSGIYPESIYYLLSPEYCKLVKKAEICKFEEGKDEIFVESVLQMNTGFNLRRRLTERNNIIVICDTFTSSDGSDVAVRFCLHPNCKLISQINPNVVVFKNEDIYISFCFETELNGTLFFEDGYYSPKANVVHKNTVCIYKMSNISYGVVTTTIKYGKALKDVIDTIDILVHGKSLDVYLEDSNYKTILLLKDNSVIKEVYSNNHTVTFDLPEKTDYTVCVLKPDLVKPKMKCLERNFSYSAHSISIFGSCVTRDLFEYDKSDNFEVKQYIARQSIISAVSSPIDLEENQINLNSNFQKRMVLMDLKKNCFENLKENRSDYLIIDLIDERFPLLFYKNSYCTASNEVLQGIEQLKDLPTKQKIIYKGMLSIKDESLDCNSIIREFCERIMRIYKPDEIILHRALFVDKYINRSGDIVSFSKNYLIDNKTKNQVLEYMYDLLVNFIPGIHIINEMPQTVASENHKWGLSPMHYYDDYYLRVLKRLNEIISNRENL